MTPEGKVKDAVKKLLVKYHVYPIHNAADHALRHKLPVLGAYFMPVSGGMGVHGIPDFICTVDGRMVTIETKAKERDAPTTLQEACMLGLRYGGAHTLVVKGNNLTELEGYLASVTEARANRSA